MGFQDRDIFSYFYLSYLIFYCYFSFYLSFYLLALLSSLLLPATSTSLTISLIDGPFPIPSYLSLSLSLSLCSVVFLLGLGLPLRSNSSTQLSANFSFSNRKTHFKLVSFPFLSSSFIMNVMFLFMFNIRLISFSITFFLILFRSRVPSISFLTKSFSRMYPKYLSQTMTKSLRLKPIADSDSFYAREQQICQPVFVIFVWIVELVIIFVCGYRGFLYFLLNSECLILRIIQWIYGQEFLWGLDQYDIEICPSDRDLMKFAIFGASTFSITQFNLLSQFLHQNHNNFLLTLPSIQIFSSFLKSFIYKTSTFPISLHINNFFTDYTGIVHQDNIQYIYNGFFKFAYNNFTYKICTQKESRVPQMKQYQFKTTQNATTSGAKNGGIGVSASFSGPAGYGQGMGSSVGGNNTNAVTNISDMKNKLNELLKATESLSMEKKLPPANKNVDKNGYAPSTTDHKYGSGINASWDFGVSSATTVSSSKEITEDYPSGANAKVNSTYSEVYNDGSYNYQSGKGKDKEKDKGKDQVKENKGGDGITYDFSKNNGFGKVGSAYAYSGKATTEQESASTGPGTSSKRYESNYNFSPLKNTENKTNIVPSASSTPFSSTTTTAQSSAQPSSTTTQQPKKQTKEPQKQPQPEPPSKKYQTFDYNTLYSAPNDYSLTSTSSSSSTSAAKKQQQKPLQIPTSLSECQYKLKSLDQEHRKLKQQLQEMTDGKQYYRKELSQQWRNNKKQKQQYEQKIADIKKEHAEELAKQEQKHKNTIEEYEAKIREIKREHKEEIAKLDEVIIKKEKNIVALVGEVAEAKVTTIHECYEQKAKKVLESNEELIKAMTVKETQITTLKSQIVEKTLKIDELTQKLMTLEEEVVGLNNFKNEQIHSQVYNFDQIMKIQLKSIAEFKQIIQRLNLKNNQLRQKYVQSSRKNEALANENRISQLKSKTTLNTHIMQSAVDLSNKQNLISTLNKKIITLEQKYKSLVNEIKSKDEFLKQHLVGRTDSAEVKEYIEGVLVKYRQYFAESREDQLLEDLERARKKIELYEKYG